MMYKQSKKELLLFNNKLNSKKRREIKKKCKVIYSIIVK